MVTLDEAVESAKLSAGPERILRQQHYEDLIQQLPEEARYPFTMALAELHIGPRTGHREASQAVADFLKMEPIKKVLVANVGLSNHEIEERLVHAAMHKDAQWWQNLKQKFKDWWDGGPEDEYEEEYGEPFPMREPGTEDLYDVTPSEVVGPPQSDLMPLPEPEPEPHPSIQPVVEPIPHDVPLSEDPAEEVFDEPSPQDFGDARELPQMVPISSSNLESAGYDPTENLLYIVFSEKRNTPRTMYRYMNVSESEFNELMNAESQGKYFHRNIRNTKQYTGPIDPSAYGI